MRTPAAIHPPAERTVVLGRPAEPVPPTLRQPIDTTPLPAILSNQCPRVRGYEVLSVLGTGGMGVVYEARHHELNRRVAIKTLRGDALADPEFRERFRAEAEAIAKLQHPNVIQVFEVGTVEPAPGERFPSPYIVLEFVDGGSLAAKARAPQKPGDAARTIATLARAVQAAHELGVIHRDLKPANVLLGRDGEPKIADFGIAKQIDAPGSGPQPVTRAGVVMGTPEYMSPEQLEGETAVPSIDIYALGVILYQLLTGRVPFHGATFADTMRLTLRQEPVPPRRLQPSVPLDLETVCLKCLEKDPRKRYPSALALAEDLERFLDGRPTQARPLGPVGRAVKWARRNRAVAALTAAVLVVAAAGFGGVLWAWSEARFNEKRAFELMGTARNNADRANRNAERAEAAAENERRERYRVLLMAASVALRLHDTAGARRALDACPADHRDWVWDLLRGQLDRSVAVVGGPDGPARACAFSANGRWAVTAADGPLFVVWNLEGRRKYGPFPGPPLSSAVAIHDDGQLVYGTESGEVVALDPVAGAVRHRLRGHRGAVHQVLFRDGGTRAVTHGADGTVRVWNLGTGAEQSAFQTPADTPGPLLLSPDGRRVASRWEGHRVPRFWEVDTGRELGRVTPPPEWVLAVAFSPDGTRAATCGAYPDKTIRLWEVDTGRQLAAFVGHENQVSDMVFRPDGKFLASASSDRTIRLWDLTALGGDKSRTARHTLEGHTGSVARIAFSPDGTRLLSASHDRTLRYWNVDAGKTVAVLHGHTDAVLSGQFWDGGAVIASHGADGTLRLWDTRAAEDDYAIRGHGSYVYGAAFGPDGTEVVSSAWDHTARVWDAATGRERLRLDHGPVSIVSSAAVSPDGRLIATLCRKHGVTEREGVSGVRLWDARTGALVRVMPLDNGHFIDSRVVFSPDGKLVAAGTPDGRVCVWSVAAPGGPRVFRDHEFSICGLAFSPDGTRLAAVGAEGTARVWELGTGKVLWATTGTSLLLSVAWSPDGTRLAIGSDDGLVRVRRTDTWREACEPLKHGSEVLCLTFSPDGKLLATGARDNLIRLWNAGTFQEVAELSGHTQYVYALAFSPDGRKLVSGSGDKSLRVWDATPRAGK